MKEVKALGLEKEDDQFYPDRNFKNIVPIVIKEEKPDAIVLQAGSIEISNMDVKTALMNTEEDIEEHKKKWAAKVEQDSKNLFNIAEMAIKNSPDLKVIIVKRFPRFDPPSVDPIGIKSKLSKFGNSVYDQLWVEKGGPSNIRIVNFDFDCEESKYLKEILFGNPVSKHYDGTHFRGRAAVRHFTYRALQAIKPILSPSYDKF